MSSILKSIKVYGKGGINPAKVSIILSELGIPYEETVVPLADIKKPEYVAINPNGRLPAIHDPNTDVTLWESAAIIEYLIERYDPQHTISFASGTPDAWHARQWLLFQASGQGPYFGQAAWFKKFAPEQVPMAIERYAKEVNRVSGVLDAYLRAQDTGSDGPWLVGGKCSYADLSFITWQRVIGMMLDKAEYSVDDFPHVKDWCARMTARPKTKIVVDNAGRLA